MSAECSSDKKVLCPWLKVWFDKALASFLLLLFSPFFVLIFVLNKINAIFAPADKGPLFFSIERISQGQKIQLLKFRILKVEKIEALRQKEGRIDDINPLERDRNNLTWLGVYLKAYYLDEIPQLINILKGQMSFVGTRPYPLGAYQQELKRGVLRKKIIRAGLTGPVQINKGRFKYPDEDIHLDNEYIHKVRTLSPFRLFFCDVKILIQSIAKVYKGEGL